MIKKLLLLTMLAAFAFANVQTRIDIAMMQYKNKEYEKALQSFLAIAEQTQNSGIDFYIGRSYYELGNYEQALAAYDRFLINNPNHKRVQLEIAQTYMMLGLHKQAKAIFETFLKDKDVPQSVKDNIQKRLVLIENSSKHSYTLTLLAAIGYDSNIDNTTNHNSYSVYIPAFDTNFNISPSKKRDSFTYEGGIQLNHLYNVDTNLALKTNASAYYQEYERDSNKKTSVVSLNSAPIFHIGSSQLMFNVGYDHVWYQSRNYLDALSFTPKLSTKLEDNWLYEIFLKLTKKDFYDRYDDRDSMQYELSNKFVHATNSLGVFGFQAILGQEQRDKSLRTDVSKDYSIIRVTNTYAITKSLDLGTNITYSQTKYKHRDRNFLSKRDDERYNFGLNLGYRFNKETTFGISYNHIKQDSNHAPFDYDKNVAKTYLYYTF